MRIYSTLTRRKEDFIPRDEGKVSIYTCGPTVYNHIHIGNARTFLNFDVIRRYLESGMAHDPPYEVRFVQNITDVDDKIINQAREEKGSDDITPEDVAKVAAKYTAAFEKTMSDLRVKPPTVAPKATEHIDGMIELIRLLIERGYGYEVDGDVYFEVRKFGDYGKLSGRALEDMRAGERVDIDERKRDPMDFALWKSAKPGEPSWDSPWGKGRPGWHIECSVMSTQYLGESFDIHGGASDLIFPHHENEIAQSEAATGTKPFARAWMHCGLLNVNKQKMAKSLGNFTLLKDVLAEGYDANTIRMLMLGTHYRKPLDFSDAALDEARAKVERIENCLRDADWATHDVGGDAPAEDSELAQAVAQHGAAFRAEMDDDFNTAGALGAIFELVASTNVFLKERTDLLRERSDSMTAADVANIKHAASVIRELTGVLGLQVGDGARTVRPPIGKGVAYWPDAPSGGTLVQLQPGEEVLLSQSELQLLRGFAESMNLIVIEHKDIVVALRDKRAQARIDKDWATSDAIRDKLAEAGLAVEDTPQGQRVTPITRAEA